MLALGCSLNIFQVRKLRISRRLDIEKTNFGVAMPVKPSSAEKPTTSHTTYLVKPDDHVFSDAWDASPIVLESHKLVFFTVPKAG